MIHIAVRALHFKPWVLFDTAGYVRTLSSEYILVGGVLEAANHLDKLLLLLATWQ